jgi:hypothetical protein
VDAVPDRPLFDAAECHAVDGSLYIVHPPRRRGRRPSSATHRRHSCGVKYDLPNGFRGVSSLEMTDHSPIQDQIALDPLVVAPLKVRRVGSNERS